MKTKFPDDFEEKDHENIPGATQWILKKNGEVAVSVVGGGRGLYGNGITTFEMWDFRDNEPKGYLSKEEINKHLESNPL